jgi:glycosyltransferase involved in cell wall biosynthesis
MNINGNILVLTQWSFKDALVQAYTMPYVEMMREIITPEKKIILVTSEQQNVALKKSEQETINADWKEKNMQLVAQPYRKFGFRKLGGMFTQLIYLYKLIRKEKISTIHAFCTPAGGIGYLLSRFTGTNLVIDSYEPHAEAMVENGTWKKSSPAFRILFFLEKKQTKRAAHLIATTRGMIDYATKKFGIAPVSFFVKPACVNMAQFFPREKDVTLLKELNLETKLVAIYAGKLGGIYLKGEVFDFIKACYEFWGDQFRFLLLSASTKEEIDKEIQRIGIPPQVVISRFVFHDEIPRYMSVGDFALNPVKPVPTKRYCTSIKDGEYWAMGLPVVISPNISDDSDIIEREGIGVVVDFSDRIGRNEAVKCIGLLLDISRKDEIKNRILKVAEKYRSFEIAKNIYAEVYNGKN